MKLRVVDKRSIVKGELSCPEFPTKIRKVKGLEFIPPFVMNSRTLYFVVVSDRPTYYPSVGFYDVPERGFITWVKEFRLVAQSVSLPRGSVFHTAYVFEAIEGHPPAGVFPFRAPGNSGGIPPGIIY